MRSIYSVPKSAHATIHAASTPALAPVRRHEGRFAAKLSGSPALIGAEMGRDESQVSRALHSAIS
jgi:hypothetical protein